MSSNSSWLNRLANSAPALKVLTLLISVFCCSAAYAKPLVFNGVGGSSTIDTVKAKFPQAVEERFPCKEKETAIKFGNGFTLCEYLSIDSHKVAGYDFSLSFFFAADGGLKTVALRWPKIDAPLKEPIERQVKDAYWNMVNLYIGKYGKPSADTPCAALEVFACNEWKGSGESVKVEYDYSNLAPKFAGIGITYEFANRTAFDKF